MSLLEYGRHVKQHRRRRGRRRAYSPKGNTASHDNHEKTNSWVSIFSHMRMGLRLTALCAAGAPLGNTILVVVIVISSLGNMKTQV